MSALLAPAPLLICMYACVDVRECVCVSVYVCVCVWARRHQMSALLAPAPLPICIHIYIYIYTYIYNRWRLPGTVVNIPGLTEVLMDIYIHIHIYIYINAMHTYITDGGCQGQW